MLREPETMITERLAVAGELKSFANRRCPGFSPGMPSIDQGLTVSWRICLPVFLSPERRSVNSRAALRLALLRLGKSLLSDFDISDRTHQGQAVV